MPPEGSSWERREILRERRYERGEKIRFARGRRDFHGQGPAAFAPPPPPPPPPSFLTFPSSNRSTWPNVLARQGRTRLLFEDGSHGFISSPSSEVPAHEKIYEDDNWGFQVEGRYNEGNREHTGSDVPAEGKTFEDENLDFRMEGRYNKRGREPMVSGLSSIDAIVQGKSYEDENLGFHLEARFNQKCRELVGSRLSSRRPSFDDVAEEKIYEEKNEGFHMEGIYNKWGRDLIIGSDLSSSYLHRDGEPQHWDSGISSFLSAGRHDTVSGKSVDQTSLHSSHLYFDSGSSWGPSQSQETYRIIGPEHASTDNKFITQKGVSENDFERFSRDIETRLDRYGSFSSSDSFAGDAQNPQQVYLDSFISQKPLKWIRSGKCSWSSTPGQACGSKESKGELNKPHDMHGNMYPHDSTSKVPATLFGVVPDDETHSRKKQRLGWGQGLAKYEKQKVEGSEDENNKSDLIQCIISVSSKVEGVSNPLETNMHVTSPKVTGSSGYMSPATTYSITCISSPADEHVSSLGAGTNDVAIEEKACHKVSDNCGNGGHVAGGSPLVQCALPVSGSDSILAESSLESEHLEQTTIISTDSLWTEGITSNFSGSEMSLTADNLLSLKSDILQKLESTECNIEKYETEMRLLISETELDADGDHILGKCTEAGDKGLCDRCSNASDVDVQVSSTMATSYDGFLGTSLDPKADKASPSCVALEMQSIKCHVQIPEENATDMKFVVSQGSEENLMNKQSMKCQLVRTKGSQADTVAVRSLRPIVLEINDCKNVTWNNNCNPSESRSTIAEGPIFASCIKNIAGVSVRLRDTLDCRVSLSSIFAANKELARGTSEFIGKFLPTDISETGDFLSDFLDSSMWKQMHERNRKQIQAKIIDKKHFLSFKERALALKFRVLRQLWKADQHSFSPRRQRAKAQKRSEISCRLNGGNQKYRLSARSRFASLAGTLTCPPTKEAIELAGKLISDGQDRPFRSVIKMPTLVLDEIGNHVRFITWNGLVDDPIAVEKERTAINPWTPEERDTFLEKFTMFGKNFSRIASFLKHKTAADCIEFYYKNQKSENFVELKKVHKAQKERDCYRVSTYLATAVNNRHRDSNAVSLDVLNAASVVAMCAGDLAGSFQDTLQKYAGRPSVGTCADKRIVDAHDLESERECTAAADVLAGICGALSSEAVSSCITGGADQSEILYENSFSRSFLKENDHPLIAEALQDVEIQYSSEESCGEVYVDWTDDEKASFVNAVTMFGRDFGSISRYVGSRTEDQCKTFFSKARKRLGLDEIMPQESHILAKGNHGSDNERGVLVDTFTGLCDTDSLAKTTAISDANAFNSDQLNIKVDTFIEGAHTIEVQDNRAEFVMEDVSTSQNEETEQNTSAGAFQNDKKMNFKEAASSPEGEHFLNDKSLTDTRGTLMDVQQNEIIRKVQGADVLCCNKDKKTSITGPYDESRDLSGNSAELKVYKTGETVIDCALNKMPIDSMERFHGVLDTEKAFIDGKVGSKKLEDVGSLTDSVSSEKNIRLPFNISEERCCIHVTSGCRRSVDTTELPAPVPCQNPLNNLELVSSSSMFKATMDESTTALHASGDVSSNQKYLIGSMFIVTGNDPSGKSEVMSSPNISAGMGGTNEISVPKFISRGNLASSSATKEIPQEVYLGDKASCATPVPVDTSDSQLKHKSSDVFSQISQPMAHYMQPEVEAWQQKHQVPSAVVCKHHSMCQERASASLVRNQKLENDMVHHYCNQGESQNQNQREICLARMPESIQQSDTSVSELLSRQFQGHQLQDHSHRNVDACNPSDYEQSSRQFGSHQLKVLHQTEAHEYRNLDAYQQGSLQQSACNSKVSSQVLGGHQLQEINLEDFCCKKTIDACQQETQHRQLVQGCSDSQLKVPQQHQVIQQNLQENVLQTLENATKEHLALAAQFLQKPVSKQLMWDQRKQSSQVAEQYEHLLHWHQKYKAHNVNCDNHILPRTAERQLDHHESGKFPQINNKFNPTKKPVYSFQSSSLSPKSDAKSCSESEEQPVKSGDVKLFGQILQSHSSNLSKLQPRSEDVTGSTASLQSSQRVMENDEHGHAVENLSSEQQSVTKYVCMYSKGTAGKNKNTANWKLKESIKDMSERFAHQGPGSKNNFTKAGTGHSGQEFGGKNLGFWEDNIGHDPCNSTMPVQSSVLHFSRDLDSQCNSMPETLSGGTCVEQAIKAGKYEGMSLDSSMIPGWHSSVIQDVPYPIKDPLATKDSDYHPTGYKELGNGYLFSLGLKKPAFLIELEKRKATLDLTPSHEPGRCDTAQSIFPHEGQMRNICGHMGSQTGRAVSGGSFVSDPVAAFGMPCSAAEQVKAPFQDPHFRSSRDQESGRSDYGR